MKCKDIKELLWQQSDMMLSEVQKQELDAHVAECSECKLLRDRIEALNEMIDGERSVELSSVFSSKVIESIEVNRVNTISFSFWQGSAYKTLIAASIAMSISFGSLTAYLLSDSNQQQTEEMVYLDDTSLEGFDGLLAEQ